MNELYTFTLTDQPTDADRSAVSTGLTAFNESFAGKENYTPLCVFMRDGENVIGGLLGETFWNWLYVSVLWIHEDARHSGQGKHMLQMAENEARQRGCTGVFLDTLSFQALDFYHKLGYTQYGQLDDFPHAGETRFYLKKTL
jgi:ribosomal protein S18 acetylase RimI-like enzyme